MKRICALVLALVMVLGLCLTARAEDKTFTILSIWPEDSDNGRILKDLTEQFIKEVNPDFKYEFELVSSDNLQQKVATLAASNDLPDVFAYESGTPLLAMIDNGYVLGVGTALKDLGVYDTLDAGAVAFLTGLSKTDELYDLPLGLNVEGFWYNKALFEKAGIANPPATWDEMLADADKLLAAGIQPFAVGAADQWPATRYINAYVMRKLGVNAMNDAAAGTIKYTDPGIVEAAKMLQDMTTKGYFGVGPTTVDYNTAANMVLSGGAAMIYNGSWYTELLSAATNPAGEDGVGFFNIPTVTGGVGTATEYSMNCGTILCMSKAKYDDTSAQWLKFFATHIADYAINNMGSLKGFTIAKYPDKISKYTQLVADEMKKVTGTSTWFEAAMSSELSTAAQQNVQSLMNGDMTPEDYCQAMQDIHDANT
jgi:raffinose/stachyose/melibiose transport system substrate-binding protein